MAKRGITCVARLCGVLRPGIPVQRSSSGLLTTLVSRHAHSCLDSTPATGLPVHIKNVFKGRKFNDMVLRCYYENTEWANSQHMCEGVKSLQMIMTCMKNTMFETPIPSSYQKVYLIDFADKVTECLATLLHHPMPYGRSAAEVIGESKS
ncbi:uncharacterized protein [Dermacentor albipictus]|uniref:uncharacterized protein isoform X3 n=1 Tax=Dermacentor albipictus TaxID=60249 RepID=UPI0038FD2466